MKEPKSRVEYFRKLRMEARVSGRCTRCRKRKVNRLGSTTCCTCQEAMRLNWAKNWGVHAGQ